MPMLESNNETASSELEKKVLARSPAEREQIALAARQSLDSDFPVERDPQGIELATRRDQEIESSKLKTLIHKEFLLRTGNVE